MVVLSLRLANGKAQSGLEGGTFRFWNQTWLDYFICQQIAVDLNQAELGSLTGHLHQAGGAPLPRHKEGASPAPLAVPRPMNLWRLSQTLPPWI